MDYMSAKKRGTSRQRIRLVLRCRLKETVSILIFVSQERNSNVSRKTENKTRKWCTAPMIPSSSSTIVPLKSTPSNPTTRSSSSAAPMGPFESTVQIPPAPIDLHHPIRTRCGRNLTHWREPSQAFQRRLCFQWKYWNRESYSYRSLNPSLFTGSPIWKPLL